MLHGMLVGPITPTYEARHAIEAPALVIGHKIDFIHPFTDADHLTRQLQHARLIEARSIFELRLAPDRLTAEIAEFLDDTWGDAPSRGAGPVGRPEASQPERCALSERSATRRPGVGVLGQLGHRAGQTPGHDVFEVDPLEHVAEAGPDRHPDVLEVLGGAVVVGRLGAKPADLGQGAVEGPHDIGHADLLGRSGQAVAALGAALARRRCRPGAAR